MLRRRLVAASCALQRECLTDGEVLASSTFLLLLLLRLRRLSAAIGLIGHGLHQRLLAAHHGKRPRQQDQPNRQEDEAVDGGVPEGDLTERAESIETQHLGHEVQQTEKGDEEGHVAPAPAQRESLLRRPRADVHEQHDEEEGQPLEGVDEPDHALRHDVHELQRSPAQLVVVAAPALQVEVVHELLRRQVGSEVHEAADELGEAAGQDEDGQHHVQSHHALALSRQHPRQLQHGEREEEPSHGGQNAGGHVRSAVVHAPLPFLLHVVGIQGLPLIVVVVLAVVLDGVVDDDHQVADEEQQSREDAAEVHVALLLCCFVGAY
mmetsp:Transcript_24071/g.67154  ORF Transcript_24071/g.67154 Transcript_24071/m.67154 type:complete len:322 (-) Transcript_24071:111-1076(-)